MRLHQIAAAGLMVAALASPATAEAPAQAPPRAHTEDRSVLRLATVAPDGTGWARELKAFGRDVEASSRGALSVRWVWGGSAGDDVEVTRQIERGRLDGVASAGMLCQKLAPSWRVLRLGGLFDTRGEARHVAGQLKDQLALELRQAGFVDLASNVVLGPELIFTRHPVSSLEELRRLPLWRWDLDELGRAQAAAMGLRVVALPLGDAARAYDEGRVDGFIGVPAAALAFQWSTRARYLVDAPLSWLGGCLLVAYRVFDRLPVEQQQLVRAAAAKLSARLQEAASDGDDALLGGLFALRGLPHDPPPTKLTDELTVAARAAREAVVPAQLPPQLVRRAEQLLSEYRAQHPGSPAR